MVSLIQAGHSLGSVKNLLDLMRDIFWKALEVDEVGIRCGLLDIIRSMNLALIIKDILIKCDEHLDLLIFLLGDLGSLQLCSWHLLLQQLINHQLLLGELVELLLPTIVQLTELVHESTIVEDVKLEVVLKLFNGSVISLSHPATVSSQELGKSELDRLRVSLNALYSF